MYCLNNWHSTNLFYISTFSLAAFNRLVPEGSLVPLGLGAGRDSALLVLPHRGREHPAVVL